ncbi:cyclin-T2-like [Syngnathoides biaculeatus]|uniref:cyclin-T2-like n=1 Tax=Syngnathoides biaculeatus TaxID=300417 RepID=UPI002ADDD76C|nr:cyclin-T2-like [Syngnathoides biaculeatus]
MLQDHSLLDGSLVGVHRSSFSKSGGTFTASLPAQSGGAPLSLDAFSGPYNPPSHSEWPQTNPSQSGYSSSCIKQEPLTASHQEQTLSLHTSASSLHPPPSAIKTEKTVDLNIKQELKGACASGAGKNQPSTSSSYPPQHSSAPKMSLDKYREKHGVEAAAASGQKGRQEQHGTPIENNMRGDLSSSSNYAPPSLSQADHRRYSQTHQMSQSAQSLGSGSSSTASPVKNRAPSATSGQDRRHHGDKWDKSSLNHLAIPGPGGNAQTDRSKEELKMKIKVSSLAERHSSSDEGPASNNKSKHSSPLVSKEKPHRGADHSVHRHHKYSHHNPHSHSGNGQGGPEGLFRGPPGLITLEGIALPHSGSMSLTSSSRKRAHPEVNHNQHPSSSSSAASCSKPSKVSKVGTAAGGLRTSQQYLPPSGSPHEVGDQRH